jgi:hypothetical protein
MSFEIWTLICVFQVLSLAKSALASNGNELSQSDITALVSFVALLLFCLCVDSSSTFMSATLVTYYLLYLLYLIDFTSYYKPRPCPTG